MSKPEVTAQYLRWRMSAALLLVLMAALAVHQIGRATHRDAIVRSEITNMLDDAQAAIIDNVIHLSAIENAPDSQRAKSIRSEMRRSLRNLENSLEALGDDMNAKAFGPDALRILSNETVEPFGLLTDFHAIVARLSKNEAAWGVASRRYVEAARTISRQVLPTIWRLKDLERSNLGKANQSLSHWSDIALSLNVVLLAAIALFIFRPMERRIIDAQEEIHRKQVLAEAASQAKSDFLAVMSHEIRTPMNGILGMAELLCQTKTDEKQDMMIKIIDRSGRALLAIINDILDFSRIEAKKISLDLQPFEFAAMAEGLVELLRPQAEAKKIFLRLKFERELAARHVGDCGRVQQILTNLIGNAIKFTNAGGVVVKVTASPSEGGNQDIDVAVTDTGMGISNDHLQRIFLPFEQADGGTSRSFGGTGLGLTISKSLAEAMGGTIVADSTLGMGSQFTLSLTLPVDASAPAIGQEDATPETPSRISRNVRILVAEDNETNQSVILQMLELAGCQSILARDGEEAVAHFESMEPDLVLMDVSMPRMDGYAATRKIRDHERATSRDHTPVIGLTAHVLPDHRQRCLDAGMDAVLSKPITRPELDQALLNHLRGMEVLHSA